MLLWIIGHLLAVGIGLSLGLIGGGGAVLAVPILIYVLGLPTSTAIAMSLIVVSIVSIIGIIPHWKQGNVNWKIAVNFTPPAMLGAFLGGRISALPWISDTMQLVSFAIVMLIASYLMISKSKSRLHKIDLSTKHYSFPLAIGIALSGFGVGIITGFVGVGGGFAIIPALVLLGGIPMKKAVGTSLLIIAFNSATGFLGYLDRVTLDWNLMISFAGAAISGVLGGAYLARRIPGAKLQTAFGYFLVAIAILILIKR